MSAETVLKGYEPLVYCSRKGRRFRMILLKNIDKTYQNGTIKTEVLKNVNLSVGKGEFVCIYGTSGSGKSTLLNILGLLDQATSGDYELDHVDVRTLGKKERARIRNQKIGFVFQAYHLIPQLNVLENIAVPLGYAGFPPREREKRARRLLDEFGMRHLEKKYISQMSGGEQQRVAIMRAIANNPSILLADEPTGNLDRENSEAVMDYLQRLNKQGMTVIMVTHDRELAGRGTSIVQVKKADGQGAAVNLRPD